jgi:hypothetical protein
VPYSHAVGWGEFAILIAAGITNGEIGDVFISPVLCRIGHSGGCVNVFSNITKVILSGDGFNDSAEQGEVGVTVFMLYPRLKSQRFINEQREIAANCVRVIPIRCPIR